MKGRTYRYMKAEPLYPFGFGLTYTHFVYNDIQVSKTKIKKNENVVVAVTLTNTGRVASDEVAQCYVTHENQGEDAPLFALKGFQRVSLAPGVSVRLKFILTPEQLVLVDAGGKASVPAGRIRFSWLMAVTTSEPDRP